MYKINTPLYKNEEIKVTEDILSYVVRLRSSLLFIIDWELINYSEFSLLLLST